MPPIVSWADKCVAFQWNINKTTDELHTHKYMYYILYSREFDAMWLKLCVTTFLWHFIFFMFVFVCVHVYAAAPLLLCHFSYLCTFIFSCCGCNCFFVRCLFVVVLKNYCLLFRLPYHVHILARYVDLLTFEKLLLYHLILRARRSCERERDRTKETILCTFMKWLCINKILQNKK